MRGCGTDGERDDKDLGIERLFGEKGDSALGIERRFREIYEWDKEYNCDLERQVTRTSI